MDETPILAVEGLSVTLDTAQVVRNVSFTVMEGDCLAVIGPNGAGKTVLLRALLGLVPCDGLVRWRADTRLGYVPQRFSVERSAPVTALEFCLLKSPWFWRPTDEFMRRLYDEIALMGLDRSILQKSLGELSGGETQRLLMAWALLQQPSVLLLDEPAAGVDAGFKNTVYALIHRIQTEHGTTVLLISHDLSLVYRYAQKVLCLNTSVVCQGAPGDVLHPAALAKLYGDAGYFQHGPDVRR